MSSRSFCLSSWLASTRAGLDRPGRRECVGLVFEIFDENGQQFRQTTFGGGELLPFAIQGLEPGDVALVLLSAPVVFGMGQHVGS